jgi:hypothetical protein
MKKLFCVLGCATLMLFLVNSCGKETEFDSSLLPGKWQKGNGKYFEKYISDGTAYYWDEAEDISEKEASHFTWTLSKAEFIQYHKMESSSTIIPKQYTLTELTATTLKYKDDYVTHSFTRVN